MLRYFYENELVAINHEQPEDWEAAIWASGEGLKQKALITDQYIEDVIRDVHQYGPYIVIIPKVAMPHSSAESKGVLGTGIGLTIFPTPVSFQDDDPDKEAQLFFMLAAKNAEAHMNNIASLSEMLMEEGLVEDLLGVKTMADFEAVMEKYDQKESRD